MNAGVVIVGAGQAGYQVAASLREAGYREPIALVGDEPNAPYERPPLSKAFLTGEAAASELEIRPARFFTDRAICTVLGRRAVGVDRVARRVRLDDGTVLAYAHLVLATGARPRMLAIPGHDLPGVHTLRTHEDAEALRAALRVARDVVVVGGGFLGLEVASGVAKLGSHVTVIEAAPRPMARAVSPPTADWFAQAHRTAGVSLELGTTIAEVVDEGGTVAGVRTDDGRVIPADVVLVAVGVAAEDELARAAGLETSNGVVVDATLTTSDPHVSAVGDCAAFPSGEHGGLIRLESVQNATDHGRAVAARLTGSPQAYRAVPWFWSEQGTWKLQIAGIATGADTFVVRGEMGTGRFSVFCFHDGRLVAVESVNRPADHVAARRMLAGGMLPGPDEVRDELFDARAFLSALAAGPR
ncbi:NAD(P)/FAD-dependent oxidoreductase [Nocardioides sp. DS6]|uniref:NAD(P)/FAD-dependent oxidoreductase n=1 Tax=Nocardioides eburneus TaxID=3231482 RepID=A0ABV3SZR4_9ACTN